MLIEEHENINLKRERGRERQRSLRLTKKNRRKKRSGSETGKIKIGNSRTVKFCSWCRPSLANRILNQKVLDIHFKSDVSRPYIPDQYEEEEEDRLRDLEDEKEEEERRHYVLSTLPYLGHKYNYPAAGTSTNTHLVGQALQNAIAL